MRLEELGLNRLEAEVYVFLLSNPPSTAYGIGKRLGRPTANVYKAVETLSRRGAVLVEEGENRLCRAVPAVEFLDHVTRVTLQRTRDTAEVLASIEMPTEDGRVYRLESAAQVLERSRQMLGRCERFAVIDAFPQALEAILPSVRFAVERGAAVYVEAYAPIAIQGAEVALVSDMGEGIADRVVERWQGQQLNVVVDGRETLTSLLNPDLTEVLEGVWSNSRYLSCLMHAGRLAEHTLVRLRNALAADPTGGSLPAVLKTHPFLLFTEVPGQNEMLLGPDGKK